MASLFILYKEHKHVNIVSAFKTLFCYTVLMTTTSQDTYMLKDQDLTLHSKENEYVLKVRDLPIEEKPREKLLQLGPHSLTLAELVAVLLGIGTKREEVMEMAQRIFKEYGEKSLMHETNAQKFADALDIPLTKACQIIASLEIGRRFYQSRAGRPVYIRNAKHAYQYLKDMGTHNKEHLRGLYLNSRYRVIHEELISVGSLTANIVHPREVFQPAIEHGAVAIIIAHNHPSGSVEPTRADLEVTHQLSKAAQLLGIELLDHLIITSKRFISLVEENDE